MVQDVSIEIKNGFQRVVKVPIQAGVVVVVLCLFKKKIEKKRFTESSCNRRAAITMTNARMVKLVDTRDLKSLDFGHPGSSPGAGTNTH